MKNRIINILKSTSFKEALHENSNTLIKGGYELLFRNIILDQLRKRHPSDNYGSEIELWHNGRKVVIDLVRYDKKGKIQEICDFGHNGTWQTQTFNTGLIDKTKHDINKYVSCGIKKVFTLGVLTDIEFVKDPALLVHYKRSILLATRNSSKRMERIATVTEFLRNMEQEHGNMLFHRSYPIISTQFKVEPHIFLCGSYSKLV
jgi:hypothetical protein